MVFIVSPVPLKLTVAAPEPLRAIAVLVPSASVNVTSFAPVVPPEVHPEQADPGRELLVTGTLSARSR